MAKPCLLTVENLSIAFPTEKEENLVVEDISFELRPNEILGIVGESGSGKSVSTLAILGLLPQKVAKIKHGSISFAGQNLLKNTEKEWQKIRGNTISMIFQEPMSALNPAVTCGAQVAEVLKIHKKIATKAIQKEVLSLFKKVKLPDPESLYKKYPHQISGGQMQRVMIAMAIACKPKVLIADEPTTALDVTVQKEIITLLKALQQETGMSIVFISHDLTLVSELADRVLVMYRGKIVEQGTVYSVFHLPKQQYTKALLHARPPLDKRLERLPTIQDFMSNIVQSRSISEHERAARHRAIYAKPPLLEVTNLEKTYYSSIGFFKKEKQIKAVNDVSFQVFEGETLGLVGESGCGKSTLGKAILKLEPVDKGQIIYRGKDITKLSEGRFRSFRKDIQIIFQDPYASLHPRMLIGEAILEPMRVHGLHKTHAKRKEKVLELLERVGLSEEFYYRYPHQLSGGQRQRVGIARTIALGPKLIVCDESVSALDISVQAQVLNLLNELKTAYGFTYIFISHDLAVVKFMADQLLVMNAGKIEEIGEADEVYANPLKRYTKNLISAIPKGK